MNSFLAIVSFELISICLMQYVQAIHKTPNYLSLAQHKNPDHAMKSAIPNGGSLFWNPIVFGIPPSRPRQFRNPEIVSYLALKKEQQADDQITDTIKKWITKEVIFDILYAVIGKDFDI